MGLGCIGLEDYAPKRSGTATSVLKAVVPTTSKKTTQLQLRINEDTYLLFKEICEQNNTDVSKAIREYINDAISRGDL